MDGRLLSGGQSAFPPLKGPRGGCLRCTVMLLSNLITVPVYGQHEYSHAVVGNLERGGAEYLIVDNRGDYPRIGNERVITPRQNLGWTRPSYL